MTDTKAEPLGKPVPKKFTMPVGWSLKQETIEKLGAMNREQRRKWAKSKDNRRGK